MAALPQMARVCVSYDITDYIIYIDGKPGGNNLKIALYALVICSDIWNRQTGSV